MRKKQNESTQYVPPEVDVLQVQVERGFYGTYPSGGGGGGGSTTPVDDPLYDFGGGLDDLTHGDL